MFLDPNHLPTVGLTARPVLIDWGNEALFLTFQRIPYGIAGGWSRYLAGKVNHIIISQGIEAFLVFAVSDDTC